MSLIVNDLKNNLLDVFYRMNNGDDRFFAREISIKIANYAESGKIATVDIGVVSAGDFTGSGIGSISVQSSICEGIIYEACKQMSKMATGGDEYFAKELSNAIHIMVTSGIVNTNVTGVAIFEGSSTYLSGTARGTFAGVALPMENDFLATFNAVRSMYKNGDEYIAEEMAKIITAYLKNGTISTQGQGVLSGSVGTGNMS